MAEVLIYYKDHWMDVYVDRAAIETAYPDDAARVGDKYDARYQKGDIIEVQETGFWIGRCSGWGYPKFVLLQVTDKTKAQAISWTKSWERNVSIERITNDTTNHVYEYRVTVQRLSTTHDYELFSQVKDKLTKKPPDFTIISRSITEVVIRVEPLTFPKVISGDITPEERIARVETVGKEIMMEFQKVLRRRRTNLDLVSIPPTVQTLLDTQHYYSNTWANISAYIKDKID